MDFGKVEASQDLNKNDDGRRKVGSKDSGEEGSPCWSRPEMDMGRRLDPVCGSTVRSRCGLCMKMAELDASWCSLHWDVVWV